MTSINKTVEIEIEKWHKFNTSLKCLDTFIYCLHIDLVEEDFSTKKENFALLHFLKIKKNYLNLKIYHSNIKHLSSSNEKLMFYLENILIKKGFNLE